MKKKLLSVLLSTAMVAGLFAAVPLTASAEGDVEGIYMQNALTCRSGCAPLPMHKHVRTEECCYTFYPCL